MNPYFFFGLTEIEIKEGETAEMAILKSGHGRGSVWVCSSSGTGPHGASEADYIPIKRLIVFTESEDCKMIKITALADCLTEPDEIFRLQLLASGSGAVGSPSVMVLTIKDMPF